MKETNSTSSTTELVEEIVKGMQEKKAHNILIINLQEVTQAVADYFVICSGNSVSQVDALAESVIEMVEENTGESPWHQEGKENKEWILLDYANVVAHIFRKDRREFYALEDLWGDAEMVEVPTDEETIETI